VHSGVLEASDNASTLTSRDGQEYADGMDTGSVGRCESARELAGDRPPTDDDVPMTRDGRRLDSPAKVLAFLEEINAQRTPATNRG